MSLRVNWVFIVPALCSIVLGFERLWRLRGKPVTLTQKSIVVALFSLGLAAAAYGSMPLTASFYNIGLVSWHAFVSVLIGAVEMVVLTLRTEQVSPTAVRAVLLRSGLVTTVLLITWPLAFAYAPPVYHLITMDSRSIAMVVHLSIFPVYIVWGLVQIIDLCFRRLRADIRRRPISTVALLMITIGCIGFVWITVVVTIYMIIGREAGSIIAYAPLPLGLCVGGAALLAVGERVYEEIVARYALFHLNPLWSRVIELLPDGLHLPVQRLPAAARLQRAYVEISDAICTLRVYAPDDQLDVVLVVSKLRRGEVTINPDAPTFSQMLPPRRTRREDLELIHALARAYRRGPVTTSVAAG